MIKSSRDENLRASEEYKTHLSRAYDLVLVENGYPLEPNYVIVRDVCTDLTEENLLHFNVSRIANVNLRDVIVKKQE